MQPCLAWHLPGKTEPKRCLGTEAVANDQSECTHNFEIKLALRHKERDYGKMKGWDPFDETECLPLDLMLWACIGRQEILEKFM